MVLQFHSIEDKKKYERKANISIIVWAVILAIIPIFLSAFQIVRGVVSIWNIMPTVMVIVIVVINIASNTKDKNADGDRGLFYKQNIEGVTEPPEEERENHPRIPEPGAVALNFRRYEISVEKLPGHPHGKYTPEPDGRAAVIEIRQRQRYRQTHYRTEKRNQIEHPQQETDEKAVRQSDQRETEAVQGPFNEADHHLPLEETDQNAYERIDLFGDKVAGFFFDKRQLIRHISAADILRHHEISKKDYRDQHGDHPEHARQNPGPGV